MKNLISSFKGTSSFLILSATSFVCFIFLSFLVSTQNSLIISYNKIINSLFFDIATEKGASFFLIVTELGNPLFMVILLLSLILWSLYKKRWDESFVYSFVGVGAAGSVFLIKHFLGIERPHPSFIVETGNSFPSGHTTLTFLVGFLVAYFFVRDKKPRHRFFVIFLASFYFVIISISRLYLGVHWFVDILGGFLLGLSFLSFSVVLNIFFKKYFLEKGYFDFLTKKI
jgi:undecaprenyl-diphosphatase